MDEPAFPVGSGDMRDPTGMTLRDYFAAKAMRGELCAQSESQGYYGDLDKLAANAYNIADAMLRAREPKS